MPRRYFSLDFNLQNRFEKMIERLEADAQDIEHLRIL